MGSALRQAGIDTRNLSAETSSLNRSLNTLRRQQQQIQNIENAKAVNKTKRADLRGQMFDAVALGSTMYGALKPAVDFEYAMAKVGAITNEAADSEGFKNYPIKPESLAGQRNIPRLKLRRPCSFWVWQVSIQNRS